ncbi:D-alanyl-D-alanine carboxypeptidase [Halomonas heilongjiangensis]|uniref:D-alanyl-D-alanine carboxypeptidase n=2 Tax=Halomonas heilongjiangensis TaxID=1387883 RepID=A0A2N7TL47_9GAMM|nr:D-alanyl-D-alanine carboxypeptidase [Halomonas heilongjiangensis]PXX94068.1 D-alanyl-D-alanine carboxypeptidase [Halomonas heilongjiangensis]
MVTATITTIRRHGMVAFVLLACLAMSIATTAQANPRYAAIVVDVESGEVLHAANADETRYPASLTKMMTLYLLFEALENGSMSLHQALPVSAQAAAMPASKLWLKAGSSITVEDAILALVVRSANDVAVVIAEALGGSERQFGQMMTAKARELGMPVTQFRNASGLPDNGQTTTARDMATLSIRLMQDFPQYYRYFSTQSFTYRGTTHNSHNRLVRNYAGADGLKTGFIRASGFNVATSAVRDGRRILSVVMGGFTAQSRDTHMADLLDRGFARASLLGRGDWVAQSDFSGDFMANSGGRQAPETPAAPRGGSSTLLASLETSTIERQVATSAPPAVRSGTAQGSAEDPIRDLIARSAPPAASSERVVHRLEPVGPSGGWGVQVGAFSDADNARSLASRAADRLTSELAGARIDVNETNGPQKVFRARLVNLDENQAYRACRSLVQEGMDCMVINAGL